MQLSRRTFIKGSGVATAMLCLPTAQVQAAPGPDSFATLIDLTRCDGCAGKPAPLCVDGCRQGRKADFPAPVSEQLRDYWPQKSHEDWSGKRQIIDRFTPYTWIFLQQVQAGGRTVSIPRRCMHCDNPPCAKLCPFGVNHKSMEGPVHIDTDLCFGGAKCRTVCPWKVPQRQAGVGLYTLWQKYLPVGGGVMYKCDLCRDRLLDGQTPYCIAACPQKAMEIGRREEIQQRAVMLRKKYDGDLYGMTEHGGTSTIYVSDVPFAEIDNALADLKDKGNTPVRLNQPKNMLDGQRGWALLSLLSPLVGIAAAFGLAGRNTEEQ